jgi:polyisoprenoid-binding protein YceI
MTKTGHAEFDSSVPLHTFTGESDHLVGKINLDDSTVDFYLDVNTLKTGISKRDKDMLETLEAEEYPFAEFFGELTSPFDPNQEGPQEVTADGEFTIHGETRDITVDGTLEKTPEGLQLNTGWTLNMEDYDIEPPGILFYRVSEEIDIRIDALLKPTD